MTNRTDITVRYDLDPRLAEVSLGAGQDEVTVQDSHDTLTRIQDTEEGAQFSDLVSSAGGETLSATTSVGLTSTLENLQYAAARTSPRSTGTATATDALGLTLTDSGATFVSDGVVRGDWIINFTDQSVTEVLTVTETAIVSRGLSGGTANTFTTGDSYKVWEVAEFGLDGGNFVAEDEFGAEISPLFTTFGRFAIKTSASSATQTQDASIQFSSYADASVWVDQTSAQTGTLFPSGTARAPVNNFADAQAIANEVGLQTIHIVKDASVPAGTDHSNMLFTGRSPRTTVLTIEVGASVSGAEYKHLLLTGPGTITGGTYITSCAVKGVTGIAGHLEQCVIREIDPVSGYSIQGNGAGIIMLNKCAAVDAFQPGTGIPVLDMNGDSRLAMRQFTGEVIIQNKTGPSDMTIDMIAGEITLDSTVTGACTIRIRGVGSLIDNSGPNVTLINDLIDGKYQQDMSFDGGVHLNTVTGTAGTRYPQGTMVAPVDNLPDALTIAALHAITHIHVMSDLTIGATDSVTGFHIMGEGMRRTAITVDPAATFVDSTIAMARVSGTLGTGSSLHDCVADGVTIRNGTMRACTLVNTTTLGATSAQTVKILDCFAGTAQVTPALDMGGSGGNLVLAGYGGAITVRNKTGVEAAEIDMIGHLTLEATMTGGTLEVHGVGELDDLSNGTVVSDGMVDHQQIDRLEVTQQIMETILRGRTETDPTTGLMTVRDAAGNITLTAQLYEDSAGTQTYRGEGADRRERLQ